MSVWVLIFRICLGFQTNRTVTNCSAPTVKDCIPVAISTYNRAWMGIRLQAIHGIDRADRTDLNVQSAVPDGEIVCLDDGNPLRAALCGLRTRVRNTDLELRASISACVRVAAASEGFAVELQDVEGVEIRIRACLPRGIVAKWKDGRYNRERQSSWIKIKNPADTQIVGREKLFEKGKPLATA